MKKIILVITLVSVLFLTSCAGVSDWSFKLPNGYEVWRINSEEIIIKYVGDEPTKVNIPSFVKEFSYDDRYVFTRNVDNISDNNILEEKYYALDTKEEKVYGPFDNMEELQNQANELKCQIPKKWYRTSSDPDMDK